MRVNLLPITVRARREWVLLVSCSLALAIDGACAGAVGTAVARASWWGAFTKQPAPALPLVLGRMNQIPDPDWLLLLDES